VIKVTNSKSSSSSSSLLSLKNSDKTKSRGFDFKIVIFKCHTLSVTSSSVANVPYTANLQRWWQIQSTLWPTNPRCNILPTLHHPIQHITERSCNICCLLWRFHRVPQHPLRQTPFITITKYLSLYLHIFTYTGTHTQAHTYNQHTRGMATTRHRSLVGRGGRKTLLETLHTHKKKISEKNQYSRI